MAYDISGRAQPYYTKTKEHHHRQQQWANGPIREVASPATNARLLSCPHHLGPVWWCISDTTHSHAQLKGQQSPKS